MVIAGNNQPSRKRIIQDPHPAAGCGSFYIRQGTTSRTTLLTIPVNAVKHAHPTVIHRHSHVICHTPPPSTPISTIIFPYASWITHTERSPTYLTVCRCVASSDPATPPLGPPTTACYNTEDTRIPIQRSPNSYDSSAKWPTPRCKPYRSGVSYSCIQRIQSA